MDIYIYIYIYIQTSHFADFKQFKQFQVDSYFANFGQVKIDPICFFMDFGQVTVILKHASKMIQTLRLTKIQDPCA